MTDGPDPSPWQQPAPTADTSDVVRSRQRGRSIAMALLLGALVVLIFLVSIAKITAGMK
ncbi:hypothetical protein [Sphingomonas bacterium]|uniref:hypothetical protein n=1 Tax=Sphingomonas bacterium TaxID=1895847 RepID=UPI00157591E9|nr:hypothetical protein [Sphingomonas bacterium]